MARSLIGGIIGAVIGFALGSLGHMNDAKDHAIVVSIFIWGGAITGSIIGATEVLVDTIFSLRTPPRSP